jgi:hypothetical protein
MRDRPLIRGIEHRGGLGVRKSLVTMLAIASLGAPLGLSEPAQAKLFRVYTCATPDDRPLGPTIDLYTALPSGWTSSYTGSLNYSLNDHCLLGGPFEFRVESGPMAAGASLWARWTPAPGTDLVGAVMRWIGDAYAAPYRGEGTVQLTVATDQETLIARNSPVTIGFDSAQPNFSAALRPARWFEIRFTCLDSCAAVAQPSVRGWLNKAAFDVEDSSSPVGGLVGSATDAQTWSRSMRFALNASDVGGGVAYALVEVDGTDALSIAVRNPAGTCRDVGPNPAVPEYAAAQPCPLRIDNGSLDVDTTKLPQGRHVVRVLLEDAAGNRTAIFGPVTRNITSSEAIGPGSDPALRGAANGDGASDAAKLTAHWGRRGSRTLLVSRFGRSHVVRGRLRTTDGAPIANAALDVVSKTTAVNARELVKRTGPRTGADGAWFVVLPRGVSSRDVTFRYRSHVNDTIASATASVRLRVRAGVHLAIHPRRARTGQAIRFSGRLLGGPMPRGGKQVVLMARASRGAWVRFNVVRTDGRGRFRSVYRFRQPGRALYRFRALSLSEAAYPYLAGGSNVVKVRKR